MSKTILICVSSALIGVLVALAYRNPLPRSEANAADSPPGYNSPNATVLSPPGLTRAEGAADSTFTPEEQVNVAVYENVNRSVVNINTKSVTADRFFFEVPSEGAGSGSVLDKRGHVLTNFHVVEGAREIQVTLFDGKSYEARLVGKDASSDIAVLKIDAPAASLYPVVIGDTSRLKVGQRVFAIGNPFGLERTLTIGIISSLNRTLPGRNNRSIKNIIQIDAAINPGNSGGPLLDTHSRLIGMNTAIASKTGQNTGVGFAIPAASIARIVPQLIEKGKVLRPETGIARVYESDRGLVIASLVPNGPAEQAGLRGFKIVKERKQRGPFVYEYENVDRSAADIVVAVDGKRVTKAEAFLSLVEAHQPGEEVVLTVIREGQEVPLKIQLSAAES